MANPPDLHLRNSTEIQGDILAGFNKDNRMYLFLTFPDQSSGRAWLKELIPLIATTKAVAAFNGQFSAARAANGGVDPPNLKATWVNVSLTYQGLKTLLKADPASALNTENFNAFVEGPTDTPTRATATDNGDTLLSAAQNWIVGGPNQTIHAMLNIQADDPYDLSAEVQKLRALVQKHGLSIVFEQPGATLPGALRGHEHFGFKDGISQPGVAGFDTPNPNEGAPGHVLGSPGTEMIKAGEFILGEPVEADSGGQKFSPPPNLSWMVNGSFQVFRRLKQDVPAFIAQENANLSSLPAGDPLHGMLGAKLVGRWKRGTPIDLAPNANIDITDKARINNFNFITKEDRDQAQGDADGFRCPRFAHVRKVYPRQKDSFGNRARRVIRRGVPFGLPFDPAGGSGHDAHSERGLVFVAYMSSIEEKFEFLMRVWVNNPDFPVPGAGPDPIIGDAQPRPSPYDLHRQGKPDFKADFPRIVHTSGTLYAFTPSLKALNGLANGTL